MKSWKAFLMCILASTTWGAAMYLWKLVGADLDPTRSLIIICTQTVLIAIYEKE